jgi:hypothetical protein
MIAVASGTEEVVMNKILTLGALLLVGLVAVAGSPLQAKERHGSGPAHVSKPAGSTGLLRGGGGDRKGGRYLAAPSSSQKKLPGKKKPPTLTLKRGKNAE